MSRHTVDAYADEVEPLTLEDVEWIAKHTDLPPHIIVFLQELVVRREQGQPIELPSPVELAEPEYFAGEGPPEEELELGEELTFADLEWFEAHPDCSPLVIETLARVIAEREKRRSEEEPPGELEPEAGPDEPPAPEAEAEPEEELDEPPAPDDADPPALDDEEPPADESAGQEEPEAEPDEPPAPDGGEPPADASTKPEEPAGDPPASADAAPDDAEPGDDTPPEEGSVIVTDGAKKLAAEEGFDLSGLIEARRAEAAEGKVVKITRASVNAALRGAAEAS